MWTVGYILLLRLSTKALCYHEKIRLPCAQIKPQLSLVRCGSVELLNRTSKSCKNIDYFWRQLNCSTKFMPVLPSGVCKSMESLHKYSHVAQTNRPKTEPLSSNPKLDWTDQGRFDRQLCQIARHIVRI